MQNSIEDDKETLASKSIKASHIRANVDKWTFKDMLVGFWAEVFWVGGLILLMAVFTIIIWVLAR